MQLSTWKYKVYTACVSGFLIFFPVLAVGEGIGGMASSMMDPVVVLADFVHSACLVIGICFLFAGVIKYFEHRRSPLMVTLGTVAFLLIAGAVLVTLPLVSYLTSSGIPYTILKK
jgi:hypothetical protein